MQENSSDISISAGFKENCNLKKKIPVWVKAKEGFRIKLTITDLSRAMTTHLVWLLIQGVCSSSRGAVPELLSTD